MAHFRWAKVLNVAVSANRIRILTELGAERRAQMAMMAALAIDPQEARTRDWEAQIPADVEAPMRQVTEALMDRTRDALFRGQLERDLWPAIRGPGDQFFECGDAGPLVACAAGALHRRASQDWKSPHDM